MNMSTENSDSSAPNESLAAKEEQGSTYMASDEDQDGYDQKYGEDSEEMRRRVAEMEEELLKISNMQQQVERQINSAADKIDENSIYVGQVDYEATPEELRAHFAPCGTLNRITIVCDKITGHPKGFAYIEFSNKESVDNALKLDDTLFKGRQLKVLPKRQNIPMSVGRGRGRGRFGGGAGRGGRFPSGGRFASGGRAPGRFGAGGRRGGASFRGRGGTGYHAAAYY